MSTKRIYRRADVKQIELETLRENAIAKGGSGTTVGLDIAKAEIVAVVRWGDGSFERPWSVKNPSEIGLLVERLLMLKEVCCSLIVGLDSNKVPSIDGQLRTKPLIATRVPDQLLFV